MTKFSKYLTGFTPTKKKVREVKVYDCPREQIARDKNKERCKKYYHANKNKKYDN